MASPIYMSGVMKWRLIGAAAAPSIPAESTIFIKINNKKSLRSLASLARGIISRRVELNPLDRSDIF